MNVISDIAVYNLNNNCRDNIDYGEKIYMAISF